MGIGVLSPKEVQQLYEHSPRRIFPISDGDLKRFIGESSIDVPLGDTFWEMKGSCRTGLVHGVEADLIPRFSRDGKAQSLSGEKVLRKNNVYLFHSEYRLNLEGTKIRGKATAKSSIGRLDVLVRLLCDRAEEFDRLPEEYDHDLYVEVTPISFDLVVRRGTCLSQLRLFRGTDRLVNITKEEFEQREEVFPVIDGRFPKGADPSQAFCPFRLDLSPTAYGFSGFVAKEKPPGPIDPRLKQHYDPEEYWEPVSALEGAIELKPNRLYILRSKERLRLPGDVALECQAYTETMGEWRIEYAGFAHPWFGYSRDEGTPLIFEVRGHNVPTILTDKIPLGNVCFKRMSSPVEKPKEEGQYEQQELALSGCFKPWTKSLKSG